MSAGAGCGDGATSDLAELAPPDAPLYAEALLRPDSEQVEAIDSIASQAGGTSEPGERLAEELEAGLAGHGLEVSYAQDIEPWLGDHAAVFVRSFEQDGGSELPDFAALLEVEDADAAQEFIGRLTESEPGGAQQRTYGGFEYLRGADGAGYAIGIVSDALVIGTEPSFKVAVDAAEGESLAESAEFIDRAEALDDDRLATVFLEPSSVVDAAVASGELSPREARLMRPLLSGVGSGPLSGGISLGESTAAIEVAGMVADGDAVAPEAPLLGELPADAALAVAGPHLGETLELVIDQLQTSGLPGAGSLRDELEARSGIDLAEVADWLGDVSGFVAGTSAADLVVGMVAETTGGKGPRGLLDAVQAVIQREEPRVPLGPAPAGAEYGFSLGLPALGPQAGAGVFGDDLVAALGTAPAELLDPTERLADADLYGQARDALGEDFAPLLFIDLPAMVPFLRTGGADEGRDYGEAESYLEALRYAIGGARVDDLLATLRLTVAIP